MLVSGGFWASYVSALVLRHWYMISWHTDLLRSYFHYRRVEMESLDEDEDQGPFNAWTGVSETTPLRFCQPKRTNSDGGAWEPH